MTPKARQALQWFADASERGEKHYWQEPYPNARIALSLVKQKLVDIVQMRTRPGFITYQLTDAGRKALDHAKMKMGEKDAE